MNQKIFWVYILQCDNDSFYTGYTTNFLKRYQSHVNGTGRCKYTKSFKPIAIAQSWQVIGDKSLAMQLERAIKQLTRTQKEEIIKHPELMLSDERIRLDPKLS